MSESDLSKREAIMEYWGRHKPGKDRLADAPYEIKDLGPFDNDPTGMKVPVWFSLAITLFAAFIAYWAWYSMLQPPENIDFLFLEQLNLVFLGFGFIIAVACVAVALDLHKGIAGAYKYILLLHMWFIGRKSPVRPEWRVLGKWELWNPITKRGAWRDPSEHKDELELETLKTQKERLLKELEAIKQEQKDVIVDGVVEIGLKKLGVRFSSVKELIGAARMVARAVEGAEGKDEIKEVMALRQRFIVIIEALDIDYFVTLLHCEGDLYPLVVSDLPLFGGDEEGRAEFAIHEMSVRSWLPWAARTVMNACLGAVLHLTDYKFYKVPHRKLSLRGLKEETVKYAPIVYIVSSDGQTNSVKNRHLEKTEKEDTDAKTTKKEDTDAKTTKKEDKKAVQTKGPPSQMDVIQTELIYGSSVADDLFEKNKLVTSQLDRNNKSKKELEREFKAELKATLAQGIRHIRRTGNAGQGGILSGLRISLGTLPKYIFYCVLVIMAFFGLVAMMQMFGVLDLGWFTPPGNGTADNDDWGVIFKVFGGMFL